MNLSISAPFLVGNQPEVYNVSVGQFRFKRASFTLHNYITIIIRGCRFFNILFF
nr:MAG TPA: Brain specific membrane anchored protein [Caudoviricetes sp.]